MNKMDSKNPNVYYDNGIFYEGKRILENKDLPFTSHHFIQNILSAVAACISLNMDIEDIKISKPLLLVETDSVIGKGYFSAKVIKTAEESKYKIGDTIYTDSNYFVPFAIDNKIFENIYQINETTIKGEINA